MFFFGSRKRVFEIIHIRRFRGYPIIYATGKNGLIGLLYLQKIEDLQKKLTNSGIPFITFVSKTVTRTVIEKGQFLFRKLR